MRNAGANLLGPDNEMAGAESSKTLGASFRFIIAAGPPFINITDK
jgi:hypothetical protein